MPKGNSGKVRTEGIKKQWSEAHTGKVLTESHIGNMKAGLRRKWSDPLYKAKMKRMHKEVWKNPEMKEKQHQALIEMWERPRHREKVLATIAEKWLNPEFRDKQIKAMRMGNNIKPNKPETIILELLGNMYPNEWEFVGDGSLVMRGLCPDFFNVNGKRAVILFHGLYWHLWKKQKENPYLTREEVEERDIGRYESLGYDCLIIWEDELDDMEKVAGRIGEFAS